MLKFEEKSAHIDTT